MPILGCIVLWQAQQPPNISRCWAMPRHIEQEWKKTQLHLTTKPRSKRTSGVGYSMMWGIKVKVKYIVSGASTFGKLRGCRIMSAEGLAYEENMREKGMIVSRKSFRLCLSFSGTGCSRDSIRPRRHTRQIDLRPVSGAWSHDRWLARYIVWSGGRRPWNIVRWTA